MVKKKKGFTLIEIIVVLVILAVLAAVTIPSMLGFVDSTDEYLCKSNRGALQRLYKSHVLFHNCKLDDFGKGNCAGLENDIKDLSCPSGGEFSSDDDRIIKCSIHGNGSIGEGGEEEKPESGLGKLPGTNIDLVESCWPTDEEIGDGKNYKFVSGGVFKHSDGKYYVIVKSGNDWIGKNNNKPENFIVPEWVRELSGKVVEQDKDDKSYLKDFASSDICKIGDDYYVRKEGANGTYETMSPNANPNIWYKLPNQK